MALILQSSLTCYCASATNNRHFLHLSHHSLSKSLLPPIKSHNSSSSDPPISTQSTDDISGSSSNRKKGREVIRRAPVETPKVVPKQEEKLEEHSLGENLFLLAWSGIGTIILVEGLLLAASAPIFSWLFHITLTILFMLTWPRTSSDNPVFSIKYQG